MNYDEGGSGCWPEDSLAASLDDAIEADIVDIKERRRASASLIRKVKEQGGVAINGKPFPTDERTQGKLSGAALSAVIDPNYSVRWKFGDGSFLSLSASDLIEVAQAVRAHIQCCFDREKDLIDAINAAATFSDLAAIDLDGGWPA